MRCLRVWLILLGANVRGKALREWFAGEVLHGRGSQLPGLALLIAGSVLLLVQVVIALIVTHGLMHERFPDSWAELGNEVWDSVWPNVVWYSSRGWYTISIVSAAGLTLAECVFLRWLFVWMRARWVITSRERCTRCAYPLAGLSVNTAKSGDGVDGWVTCAECGHQSPAVAAWGEIVETGGAENASVSGDARADGVLTSRRLRFKPADSGEARAIHLVWTRRRVRILWHSAAIGGGVAVLAVLARWGAGEIDIRWQASLARKERQTPEAITALVRGGRPSNSPGGPSVTDLVFKVHDQHRALWDVYMQRHAQEQKTWSGFGPHVSNICLPSSWLKTEEDKASLRAGLELLVELRDQCVFDLIDEIPAATLATPGAFVPIDSPSSRDYTVLGATRTLTRICAARMRLASDAGKISQFIRAWRAGRVACDALENDATMLHWWTLTACEQMFWSEIVHSLNSNSSPEWIDAIAREWADGPPRSITRTLEYEHARAIDNIDWYFSNPSRVRKGLSAPELKKDLAINISARSFLGWPARTDEQGRGLGTYKENRDATNAAWEWLKEAAKLEDAQARRRMLDKLPNPENLVIPQYNSAGAESTVRNLDVLAIQHRGISLMLMIEQYRIDHGEYPETLDDLGPAALSPCLFDPFAGEPMRYKKVEPMMDAYYRGYLLWSVGYDGVDNDATQGSTWSWTKTAPGTDTVINDPDGLR